MTTTRPGPESSRSVAGTAGERILVLHDHEETSRAAVRWVAHRLGRRPASVRVIGTTARPDAAATFREEAVRAAEVVRAVAPHAHVSDEVVVGDPEQVALAAAVDADLLVVGAAADEDGDRKALPARLAARAHCVVVIVPVDWAPSGGRTVAAVSIDTASDAALEFAADHARREGSELELVHAWDLPTTGELHVPEGSGDGSIPDAQRRALESFAAGLRAPDLTVTAIARQGRPAAVLSAAAEEADLLVVGRRARGPLARAVLGSVSRSLAEHPPCPIAVVPQPSTPLRVVGDRDRESGL